MFLKKQIFYYCADLLWDLFCFFSVIGWWPRFIEPNVIITKRINFPIKGLHKDLHGFKILHLSDLHFNRSITNHFLNRISAKVSKLSPDVIVFTGDFICYSNLEDKKRLKRFLCSLKAPYGCYYIYGNHDYQFYVTKGCHGVYIKGKYEPLLIKSFKHLFGSNVLDVNNEDVQYHNELHSLLKETQFQCMENKSLTIHVKNATLNVCGFGDYWIGKCVPEEAFQLYDRKSPGIILLHNPDAISMFENYPGDLFLCGHTHGGQLNLPFLWKKFIPVENKKLKRGIVYYGGKNIFINKGIGSHIPFRWFACPEIVMITLLNNER